MFLGSQPGRLRAIINPFCLYCAALRTASRDIAPYWQCYIPVPGLCKKAQEAENLEAISQSPTDASLFDILLFSVFGKELNEDSRMNLTAIFRASPFSPLLPLGPPRF